MIMKPIWLIIIVISKLVKIWDFNNVNLERQMIDK